MHLKVRHWQAGDRGDRMAAGTEVDLLKCEK